MTDIGKLALDGDVRRAVEALAGRNGAQVVTEQRATTICTRLAEQAYRHGRHDALMALMTTPEVAELLGVTRAWLHRVAARYEIGWRTGRDRLYLPEDVERLREIMAARRPGRPRTEAAG